MSHSDYVIEMRNIRKEFPGIVANDDISLCVKQGEIHAILGENGAGKSTLMSILFGLYHADRGEIYVKGNKVKINSPNDANDLGIGMVHQHFKLIHNFTVTENIILGKEGGFILNEKEAEKRIKELSDKYGLFIEPDALISNITVGMQQRVEILKMLYRNADILIFDEPTAVLTPQEINELMQIMRNLAAEGKAIILITHKLQEILDVADKCTIIRRGKLIDVVDVASTTKNELASKMVGRPVDFKVPKGPSNPGKPILEIKNLNVLKEKKLPAVRDFSLEVRAGEIVGIAGVDGNGQSELVYALSGLMPVESGSILLDGKDITNFSVRKRAESGLGHVPEDRQKHGLILQYSIAENMVIKSYYKQNFQKHGFLNKEKIKSFAQKISEIFDVRSGSGIESKAGNLSGGNQQKAILGREITLDPPLLIAVNPTRGLDVGAIESIHKELVKHRDNGRAVLLISFELDEIFNLSDRIAVMHRGSLSGIVRPEETTAEEVGLMMAGMGGKNE
ncbi:hypothetical protein HMPREF9727_01184 [Treponema denticola MYR-T]|uniref:ABC transporter domain-containing protein n=1 Tax=Treponema denticola H1-T TaxID=999431 RepID=M2BXQ6_TREDN|nr:ABC transporter ATP-binding protein [Treponema denticola]EMB29817.1 hypothetical protein HMPREF9725_01548 [Treponema denticola H1-T]EMB30344.1 hypothetical protein HMPREF9727_01184 [Treponema denticola MYR-T]